MQSPRPTMAAVIPGSVLHSTCVETYRRHREHDGRCVECHWPTPCQSREFAARVIEAAGEDPDRYDRMPAEPQVAELAAGIVGYALGGVGRPNVPYFPWER